MRVLYRGWGRPKILVPVLIPVLAAVALAGWRLAQTPPAVVRTEVVGRGHIEDVVLASAVMWPWSQLDVGAQVSGQLRRLNVEPGQKVRRGELLAEIDPVLAANELKVSASVLTGQRAQRAGKLAQWQQAAAEAARQSRLLAGDHTSHREAESAQAAAAALHAEIAALDAAIAQTRVRIDSNRTSLAYTRIVAPIDGEVLTVSTQQGQTVIAAQQAPTILRLADLSRMKVRALVSEADIMRIRPGLKVYFSMLGTPEQRQYAVLQQILPAPEKINNAMFYHAVFHVANPDGRFRSEMSVQVGIVLAEAAGALLVPTSALEGGAGDYRVRVKGADGRIESRKVKPGIRAPMRTQILAGVAEGEHVVVPEPAEQGVGISVSMGAGA
ncbi:efflux RND transporter periplasmic adaptor subunit [Paludibacterium yongneupense]|uniref:efflux RND transporter periplasmic adaptor subunit n=1 Tax=Paludibacterium yongneupense TaxID=400061 RepID=UPI00040E9BD3|nr:efflux RND transporter periplasmic adaptor subunit [Paludibacterium yongneupense]